MVSGVSGRHGVTVQSHVEAESLPESDTAIAQNRNMVDYHVEIPQLIHSKRCAILAVVQVSVIFHYIISFCSHKVSGFIMSDIYNHFN